MSERLKDDNGQSESMRRKYFAAEKLEQVADQPRRMRFVISTADVDRDNDVVNPNGWELQNYLNNPVVLWAHSHRDLPIGKTISLSIEGNSLVAEAEFATHPFAETVFQLLKGGFLRAVSVGFKALKYVVNEQRGGIDFERQELLEFSVCPVPANPMALVSASASGIDLEPMHDWVKSMVDNWPGGFTKTAPVKVVSKSADDEGDVTTASVLAAIKEEMKETRTLLAALVARKDGDAGIEPAAATDPVVVDEPAADPTPAADASTTQDAVTEDDDEGFELVSDDPVTELEFELVDPMFDLANEVGVTKAEFAKCMGDAIRAALADVTQEAVQTAVNQARGRLD